MNTKLRSLVIGSALVPSVLFQACMASPDGFDPEDGETAISALSSGPAGPKVYIVRFKAGVDADAALMDFENRHVFSGGAMVLPNAAAVAAVAQDPRVAGFDQDMPVSYGKPAPGPSPTPAPQKEPTGYQLIGANAGSIQVANMSLGGSGSECSTSSCTKTA